MNSETLRDECSKCRYWAAFPISDEPMGMCRRFPPQKVYDPEGHALGAGEYCPAILNCWPHTNAANWCGEFEAKQ